MFSRRATLGLAGATLFAALAVPAQAAPAAKLNKLTPAEKKAGWRLLFDGKSTKGWKGYKADEVPNAWKVVDGTLVYDRKEGDKTGDIMTAEQFENFELTLEWKIAPGGNSGVMYHVLETEKSPWQTGPEMQILDNGAHKDGKNPLTSAGSCYALYPPSKDVTKPVGEWNEARLLVDGQNVEHWLNGEKVVAYQKGSEEWTAKVAGSKFKGFANFGKPTKGHIDLQDHGDKVEFRNIKLRVIKTPTKTAAK